MTLTTVPATDSAWAAWLEDRSEPDAGPTHRASLTLRFEVDLALPPWVDTRTAQVAVLAAVSRFDRSALLALIDYDIDQFLPGDTTMVASSASVVPA